MSASGHVPALLSGREGKMNGHVVQYLSLNGPSLIYQIAKDLASNSETKVHYPTVNRRVHDLVERDYLMTAGAKATKSGAQATMFGTTIRGDFGSLATGLDARDQFKLIQVAGQKPNSPFALLKLMLDRGLPFDFVRREFLLGIVEDVMNGYINIEALNEEVICSAFAASMARKLRTVMGENRGKEYVESILGMLTSMVWPAPRAAQSFVAVAGPAAGASSGAGAHFTRDDLAAPAKLARAIPPRSVDWRDELTQAAADILRD